MLSDVEGKKYLILIIEDNPQNLQYLCELFGDYRKAVTISGVEGVDMANNINPDLILLDIQLPDIDGFEVCRRIKSNPEKEDIPIIFLSGKSDLEDVIKGLKFGAVDYITKPFDQEELMIRVKTNLELKHSKDIIKVQKKMVEQLNFELRHFFSIATHDLKNTLLVMQGFAKLLFQYYDNFTDIEKKDMLSDVVSTSEMMYRIINNLSMITQLEERRIRPHTTDFHLLYLINDSIAYFSKDLEIKNIKLVTDYKIEDDLIFHDYSLVKEVIENLISNAVKFSYINSNINIRVTSFLNQESNWFKFEIEDFGIGILQNEQDKLFQKFAKLSSVPTNKELTTGLGLSITKLILELIGGTIEVDSRHNFGSKFTINLPARYSEK